MKSVISRLSIFAAILLAVLVIGTIGFSLTEGFTIFDSFYFTITTVATVGYGDIHPVTIAGKFLVIVVILLGVGTFTGAIINTAELLIERRQHEERRERVNTLIGLFFSEIGNKLLNTFALADSGFTNIHEKLIVKEQWTDNDYSNLKKTLVEHKYQLDRNLVSFEPMRDLLSEKTDILVRLLENPVLLEHESFTELLKATFHLREELASRPALSDLPGNDVNHLVVDSARVYGLLTQRWIDYMYYIKKKYPYLFSFALRTNPFVEHHSPIIK